MRPWAMFHIHFFQSSYAAIVLILPKSFLPAKRFTAWRLGQKWEASYKMVKLEMVCFSKVCLLKYLTHLSTGISPTKLTVSNLFNYQYLTHLSTSI